MVGSSSPLISRHIESFVTTQKVPSTPKEGLSVSSLSQSPLSVPSGASEVILSSLLTNICLRIYLFYSILSFTNVFIFTCSKEKYHRHTNSVVSLMCPFRMRLKQNLS